MTVQTLLDRLQEIGASITTDGTKLNVKAAKARISPELLGEIKAQKQALIAALSKPTSRVYPQSFNQAQLWFLHQLQPGFAMYNNPLALTLEGALDTQALGQSFDNVIRRHGILRTTFFNLAGEPAQRVFEQPLCQLEITSLENIPANEVVQRCDDIVQQHARRCFDLENEAGVHLELVRKNVDSHILLLNVHHICADGWSVGILLNEILQGYFALRDGDTTTAPPLAVQYADFALAQRKRFGPEELKRQTAYWVTQLHGAPEFLTLPTDWPRPAEQSFKGAHLGKRLPVDLNVGINDLARQAGATAFAVFLAVHAIVMTRYSRQNDICVGSSLAGRDDINLEPLIGHFVNTVALRITLADNPPFSELVRTIQQTVLGAMEHQELPFDKVVEAINPVRTNDHAPLFQSMLIYQNTPQPIEKEDQALKITPLKTDSATAKFDLTIELFETEGNFAISAEYSTDLFEETSIQRCLDQFEIVLRTAIQTPDIVIDAILLEDPGPLVGQTITLDPKQSLHSWFETTASANPDHIAVKDDHENITFAQLAKRQMEFAGELSNIGCKSGTTVALLLDPDIDYVVAMLGVLKVGGCIVPIDPKTPIERLRHILTDSGATIIVAHHAMANASIAAGFTGPTIAPNNLAKAQTTPIFAPVCPDQVAAIIYTSGSTGRPKGTEMTHRSLVNLITWTQQQFSIDGAVVQKSAVSFDASLWEFLWPLLGGHTLRIVQGDHRADPSLLGNHLKDDEIAVLQFVPATLRLFLDGLVDGVPAGLSHIFCGGGELTGELAKDVARKLPHITLVNVYGVTECAVDSVFHIHRPNAGHSHAIPIGRPIANTSILLLDVKGRPVPRGAVGEICIGGTGTSTRYLNQPNEAFVKTLRGHDGPWFKTGDLARLNSQGDLEFVGRQDFQIKFNGFRIEPTEIEACLQRYGCSGAVVLLQEDTLVAYVTGCDDTNSLKSGLAKLLPRYMIPSIICPLVELPLNASGKVNRAALPRPTDVTPANAVNQTTPRDATEMNLYEVWKTVLLHPTIGIRDNFFDIGGSSISAIKLLHKLKETTGHTLSLRDVITNPTIEDLGALLRGDDIESTDEDTLITFRKGAGLVNVVCVHPAGGTAFCYLSLAKALSQDVGAYGLQSLGLNPDEALSPTVETMASHYLHLIQDMQDKPLVIAGLSFGGLVAHEMGKVLAAQGKHDVSIVLLDTQGTNDDKLRQAIDVVDMTEFREKLVRFNGTYPGISDAQIERYFNVYNHNRLSVRDYAVPVSAARTIFIQALSDLPRPFLHEVRRYWQGRTTNDLLSRLVRGDHWEMLESQELETVERLIAGEISFLSRLSKGVSR
ncbi:MAG: amino acid adenylation domain-containing protein [Litoreibacter sp.]